MDLQPSSTAAARSLAPYEPGQIAARLAAAGATLAALPGTGCRYHVAAVEDVRRIIP